MAFSASDTSMSSLEHLGVGITVCRQPVHSASSDKFPLRLSVPHQLPPLFQHVCSVWMCTLLTHQLSKNTQEATSLGN